MNERPVGIYLSALKRIDLIIGEENAVAVLYRGEIDSQIARHRKGFVPRFNFFRSVLFIVRRLLDESRSLVPGLAIFLLHRLDQIFGGLDFGGVSWGRRKQYQARDQNNAAHV